MRPFTIRMQRVLMVRVGLPLISIVAGALIASPAWATSFSFSTGNPDGLMGMASRPGSLVLGQQEIEAADDFVLPAPVSITQATFTGLLPADFPLGGIGGVDVQIYRVFPADSANPPSGRVPTRTNSPSDVVFTARSDTSGTLAFTPSILNASYSVNNTVVNGIFPSPNQTTGGEGPATGEEVGFDVMFTTPLNLSGGHYFFVPQVGLTGGPTFLWLSAPRPIVAPGTPFTPDLQTWIRNADLAPDWLRVGTDIVGGTPPPTFNGTFSLQGDFAPIPEPSAGLLLTSGLAAMVGARVRPRLVFGSGRRTRRPSVRPA